MRSRIFLIACRLSLFLILGSTYAFLPKMHPPICLKSSRFAVNAVNNNRNKNNNKTAEDWIVKDDKEAWTRFVARNQHWVVLVDDEAETRLAVGDFLHNQGYQVTACSSADALLELMRNRTAEGDLPRAPDAIISDVRMPGKDGVQLLQLIREDPRLKRIPVILLTAKAMTKDRIDGYVAGADAYLPKPFDPDELVAIVDNRIARRKQLAKGSEGMLRMELKDEISRIKELMKKNSGGVVKKTNVYLTLAEREVLDMISKGYSNAEIARTRDTGLQQVKKIVTKLYKESRTTTRTQLVRWAIETGYVSSR